MRSLSAKYRRATHRRLPPRSAVRHTAAKPEIPAMTIYRIRLVERTTSQGAADFTISAQSPQEAAIVVEGAHARAQAAGTAYVRLPDGQTEVLEPGEITNRETEFLLVGPDGETSHILMPKGPTRTQ